jgi:hypothetical protein
MTIGKKQMLDGLVSIHWLERLGTYPRVEHMESTSFEYAPALLEKH